MLSHKIDVWRVAIVRYAVTLSHKTAVLCYAVTLSTRLTFCAITSIPIHVRRSMCIVTILQVCARRFWYVAGVPAWKQQFLVESEEGAETGARRSQRFTTRRARQVPSGRRYCRAALYGLLTTCTQRALNVQPTFTLLSLHVHTTSTPCSLSVPSFYYSIPQVHCTFIPHPLHSTFTHSSLHVLSSFTSCTRHVHSTSTPHSRLTRPVTTLRYFVQ